MILTQSQAQVINNAIGLLRGIATRVELHLSGVGVTVREDTLGRIVVTEWGVSAQEVHNNQSEFATAYRLDAAPNSTQCTPAHS